MSKVSRQQTTKTRDRAEATPPRPDQPTTVGALATKAAPPRPPLKAATVEVSEKADGGPASEEDDFFARGEEIGSSFPPSAMDVTEAAHLDLEDNDDRPAAIPLTPAMIERRARLRRVVGGVVGAAALLTALVGAKTLAARSNRPTASEGTLNVPSQVVPSIALAAQEEPVAAKPAENALAEEKPADEKSAENRGPENAAAEPNPVAAAEQPAAEAPKAEAPPAEPSARKLPVIDLEIPSASDPATDRQWEFAAKTLASKDFKGADSAFAELSKRTDTATRETARLARALWWTANGRESEVKPVIADLAANAATPSIKQHARQLIGIN